jgi:hypothetical protein
MKLAKSCLSMLVCTVRTIIIYYKMSPHVSQVRNNGGDTQWGEGLSCRSETSKLWLTLLVVLPNVVQFAVPCSVCHSTLVWFGVIIYFFFFPLLFLACKTHTSMLSDCALQTQVRMPQESHFLGFLFSFVAPLRNNAYWFQCNLTELTGEKQAHAETFWVQGSSLVSFECTQGSTKHS